MMSKALPVLLIVGTLTLGLARCSGDGDKEAAGTTAIGSGVQSGNVLSREGTPIVKLDAERQKSAGLEVITLGPAVLEPETKCYGRVLDASPLAVLVAELSAAEASHRASQAELERSKALASQDNASRRSLEAAEAAEARDRAEAGSIRQRIVADWGTSIAGRQDLAAFVQALVTLRNSLVRIDLPAGDGLDASFKGARLAALGNEDRPVDAQILGSAPMVDPKTQGRAFFVLVTADPGLFAPGLSVVALLRSAGRPLSGVVVPDSAVVRYLGKAWLYVQREETGFSRLAVDLGHPAGDRWLIAGGLNPGERIVARGAQVLLSEELKTKIRIGD